MRWFAISIYVLVGLGVGLSEVDQYQGKTVPGPVMFFTALIWPVIVGVNIGRQDRDWINERGIT